MSKIIIKKVASFKENLAQKKIQRKNKKKVTVLQQLEKISSRDIEPYYHKLAVRYFMQNHVINKLIGYKEGSDYCISEVRQRQYEAPIIIPIVTQEKNGQFKYHTHFRFITKKCKTLDKQRQTKPMNEAFFRLTYEKDIFSDIIVKKIDHTYHSTNMSCREPTQIKQLLVDIQQHVTVDEQYSNLLSVHIFQKEYMPYRMYVVVVEEDADNKKDLTAHQKVYTPIFVYDEETDKIQVLKECPNLTSCKL